MGRDDGDPHITAEGRGMGRKRGGGRNGVSGSRWPHSHRLAGCGATVTKGGAAVMS